MCYVEENEHNRKEIIMNVQLNLPHDHERDYRIPKGCKRVYPDWAPKQLVIKDYEENYWTWVPLDEIQPNGCIDSKHEVFNSRYGRRIFGGPYHDFCGEEYVPQKIRYWVNGSGGFYMSSFPISKDTRPWGECLESPRSIPGAIPWTGISMVEAEVYSSKFYVPDFKNVIFGLPFGADWDTVAQWFIDSGARTYFEITEDSRGWGKFWNAHKKPPEQLLETDADSKYCTNGIWHFAGNQWDFTRERMSDGRSCLARGGTYVKRTGAEYDYHTSAILRKSVGLVEKANYMGFHAVMYVRPRKSRK